MKRVTIGVLICAAFFLCAHRPASAMYEFCPAELEYQAVGANATFTAPSALYGFALTALGQRTVTSATLAFDTSGGWYTVDVPAMALYEKDRRYNGPWNSVTRSAYVSPILYVRFPQNVKISHAWVRTIAVQDDGAFGWQAQGRVLCDPPSAPSVQIAEREPRYKNVSGYTMDPKDADALSDAPSTKALVLTPAVSEALESSNCTQPFRDATVKVQTQPFYPYEERQAYTGIRTTEVEVAINGDGTLADAWVRISSGITAFDDSSLRAAAASTYTGASAYCSAVPGRYFFWVTFDPND